MDLYVVVSLKVLAHTVAHTYIFVENWQHVLFREILKLHGPTFQKTFGMKTIPTYNTV